MLHKRLIVSQACLRCGKAKYVAMEWMHHHAEPDAQRIEEARGMLWR